MAEDLVVIGEVLRPHGLRGAVRVAPLTDRPERFDALQQCVLWNPHDDSRSVRRVREVRRQADGVLLSLEGCESPETARGLAGRLVALPRAEALPPPPGHVYPWQLVGCRVETEDGRAVGELSAVETSPAHDLWVVRGDGREHLIPAVAEIVREVDVSARRIVIRPPEGLLEL
ncbi:MAG TPA: ribosome maturation factor RimM [Methylomirabilota bacterium]|nr:ribosome maturation factor RimM [Methylomirabilota bacterium]